MTSVGRLFLEISPQAPETHSNPEERGLLKTAHKVILFSSYNTNTTKTLKKLYKKQLLSYCIIKMNVAWLESEYLEKDLLALVDAGRCSRQKTTLINAYRRHTYWP